MAYRYSFENYVKDKMARAMGRDLPISIKQSVEICSALRKKDVENAKKILNMAISKKKAIPFKRYNDNVGHKRGMAAGRYPLKACGHILELLESAESNAGQKGLSNLVIAHICAHKGAKVWRYGRRSGLKAKRSNVEIVLEEGKPKIKEEKVGKGTKK